MKTPMACWILIAWLQVALPLSVRAHTACAGVERASDSKGVQASDRSKISTPDKPDRPKSEPRSEDPDQPKEKTASSEPDDDSDESDDSDDSDPDDDDSDDRDRTKNSGKKGKKTVLSGGQGTGSGQIEPPKPPSVKTKAKKTFITCPATGKRINIGSTDAPDARKNGGQGPDAEKNGGQGPVVTADANGGKTVTGDVKIKDATITYSGGKAIDGNTGMTTSEGSSTLKGDVEIRDGVVRVEPNGTIVIVSGTLIGRDVTTNGGTQSPLDAVGDVVVDPGTDNPQVNAVYSDGPVQ